MSSPAEIPAASPSNNALDDVFGSEPDTTPGEGPTQPGSSHPSDMARLQQEHATAGYREGLTAAKAKSIQAGFDEGFSLGAAIGMKAGELLGLLDGIASALASSDDASSRRAAEVLLAEAAQELATKSIFNPEYWAADGTWRYDVTEAAGGGDGDIVFADVADSHPLIRKWTALVEDEVRRWGIDRELVLLRPAEGHSTVAAAAKVTAVASEPKPTDFLEW